MAVPVHGGFASLKDPCFSASDYLGFTGHGSSQVRRWALERSEELGLEVPEEVLRKRLEDTDLTIALTAADLAGRHGMGGLADALLARLEAAEDAVGVACAQSLADLGDRRVLAAIGRRGQLDPAERHEGLWLALAALDDPEAARLLWQAFIRLAGPGEVTIAFELSWALMRADPRAGIPEVLDRWLAQDDEIETDEMLESLLALVDFEEGVDVFREVMEPNQQEAELSLPEDILEPLSEVLPLGPLGEVRRAWRKRRWRDALEPLVRLAEALAGPAPAQANIVLPLTLLRALGERAGRLRREEEKARDAAGLMLLALDAIAQEAREASLRLPESPEEQLAWLLSDAALAYPEAQARVVARLAEAPPTAGGERACVQAIERRSLQAHVAVRLLAAWGCAAAIPVLLDALGDPEEGALSAAAVEGLAAIGEPALDAALERLRLAQDPAVLGACLGVCVRLPSRRVVQAICRQFEDLFILIPVSLLAAVEKIGASEFLEPLGRELREGEAQAEAAFALLCALHGVDDPRLPAIRQRQEEGWRATGEMAQGSHGAASNHLDLALMCHGCRRTYTYPVHAVFVDPEAPEEEGLQPFIRDRIRCKGCGREDDYALAPGGQIVLTAALAALVARMEQFGPEDALEGPLYLRRMGLSDGRRMHPREARRDYKERLAKRPDDPGLHIGYGNVLRLLGELEAAEAAYRRALELDSQAIEASVGVGQVAQERGELVAATSAYRAVLAMRRAARFYHVRDRRQFFEGLERMLEDLQGSLAPGAPSPAPAGPALQALPGQDWDGPKVARNAPCPCGSGRKYKKCCLPKHGAPAVGTGPDDAAGRLRERLAAYVTRSLPRAELQRALREFRGAHPAGGAEDLDLETAEGLAEWGAFLEWCVHDFHLSTRRTPMAQFLAYRGPSLPAEERALLEEWQDAGVGLHEVVDLQPGKSLTLRNVCTGETCHVREVRVSLAAARWDLLGGRLVRVRGEPQLVGVATPFRASQKEDLVRHLTERYEAYRRQHAEATWRDFFRAEPLIFRRYAEASSRSYRPPEVYTAEGHPLMMGTACYDVCDAGRLLAALSAAPDHVEESPPGDPAGARLFTWLRVGPAERWVQMATPPQHGLVISSQRIEDPAQAGLPSLATLRLTGDRMTIEATSAQRLAWAKGRLAELAGDAVRLRSDVVEEVRRQGRGAAEPRTPDRRPPAVPPQVETQIVGQVFHRHFTAWLDEKIPALGGLTPRAAARDPQQRPKVIQLLREMENHQDHFRQQGKAWYDVGWIWEELGISRQEA